MEYFLLSIVYVLFCGLKSEFYQKNEFSKTLEQGVENESSKIYCKISNLRV